MRGQSDFLHGREAPADVQKNSRGGVQQLTVAIMAPRTRTTRAAPSSAGTADKPLEKLTIAQIKEELALRGDDARGCKLKADFVARLEAIAGCRRSEPLPPPTKSAVPPSKGAPNGAKPFSPHKKPVAKVARESTKGGPADAAASRGGCCRLACAAVVVAALAGAIAFASPEILGWSDVADGTPGYHALRDVFDARIAQLEEAAHALSESLASVEALQGMVKGAFSGGAGTGGGSYALDRGVLDALVCKDAAWGEWADDVAASSDPALRGQDGAPPKALAVLLARDASQRASPLAASLPSDPCLYTYAFAPDADASPAAVAELRGAIQKSLVEFLLRCPRGLLVVEDVDVAPSGALVPFHNAISEQGAFMFNGRAVDATGAAAIFTVGMDVPIEWEGGGGAMACAEPAKRHLADVLAATDGDAGFAAAFRRRIDFVGVACR